MSEKSKAQAQPSTSLASMDELLTKEELAARLKVTVRCIELWTSAGKLPALKIQSVVRFHWPEVLAYLKSHFRVCRRGIVTPIPGN